MDAQPTTSSQEFFDIVCTHLLSQKVRSVNKDDLCLYRGDRGLKCAAGCQIPDALYSPAMERFAIDKILWGCLGLKPYFPNLTLAKDLQAVHDAGLDVKARSTVRDRLGRGNQEHIAGEWPDLLQKVAKKHNLEWKYGEGTV